MNFPNGPHICFTKNHVTDSSLYILYYLGSGSHVVLTPWIKSVMFQLQNALFYASAHSVTWLRLQNGLKHRMIVNNFAYFSIKTHHLHGPFWKNMDQKTKIFTKKEKKENMLKHLYTSYAYIIIIITLNIKKIFVWISVHILPTSKSLYVYTCKAIIFTKSS